MLLALQCTAMHRNASPQSSASLPQHFRNALGVTSPFSRMTRDVNGVLALLISDYKQRQVRLLDRSQDRRRALSSFGGKSGLSFSNWWHFLRQGWRRGSSRITLGILVHFVAKPKKYGWFTAWVKKNSARRPTAAGWDLSASGRGNAVCLTSMLHRAVFTRDSI